MKKITFVLFALIAGTTFAQTNVSTSAEIIEAITIAENNGLSFGKVDNTAGTVIISTGGVASGTKTQITGGTTTAAKLTISGEAEETYSITVPTTASLTGPGDDLAISGIDHTATQTLDENGEEIVNIGGTLTVAEGQTAGSYSGTIAVTVSYN